MMQEIDIATGVRPIDGTAVDKRRKVWETRSAALVGIPEGTKNIAGVQMTFRHVGLKVPLMENGEQVEYWFAGGTTDNHFVRYMAKDTTGGFVGLTGLRINFRNALNTITSFFSNANTAAREYFFPDKSGTVALMDDVNLKADKTFVDAVVETLGEDIDRVEFDLLPLKLDKDASQLPGRVIVVGADGKLIGDPELLFDVVSNILNINGALSASTEFKLKVRGRQLIEGAGLFMESTDGSGRTLIELSGGRSALIGDFNGIIWRVGNSDATDRPDTSKRIRFANKGFQHAVMYTVPLSFNEFGQPATWEMITELNNSVVLPDLPANAGGEYETLVLNKANKKVERLTIPFGTLTADYLAGLPVIDSGDSIEAIPTHTAYIERDGTENGIFKIKLPLSPSEFTSEFGNEFGSPEI